jgi:hypothetical protein
VRRNPGFWTPDLGTRTLTCRFPGTGPVVCTENSVRIDYVTESTNVSGDDRSVLLLPGPIRLAAQVEEPT